VGEIDNYGIPITQKMRESHFGNKIDATGNANKVFVIDFKEEASSSSVIDGANQLGVLEIEAWPNDYSAPTGTNADPIMKLYRENSSDAASPTSNPIATSICEGGVLRIKFNKPVFGILKPMVSFSDAKAYQVRAVAVYYTPR